MAKHGSGYPAHYVSLTGMSLFAIMELLHRPMSAPNAITMDLRVMLEREVSRREYLNRECGKVVTK